MNFGEFVAGAHRAGRLVVQPRMGFSDPVLMRAGLAATKAAHGTTVGTITLDSYTRLGRFEHVRHALEHGIALNGFPIVNAAPGATRALYEGIAGSDFPVQVRHGSARPAQIVRALVREGLHATEGGPISYCLPYGRTPLDESVRNWIECCELIQAARDAGHEPHLESFGGCMMGQLCPPSLLVAISVLEAMFFAEHGLRSVSVSYAQQIDPGQDREAVAALRRLCRELLSGIEWHVVIYTYMGLYPRSRHGALGLLADASRLAVATGAERLIVKTVVESQQVPTIAQNIEALEHAADAAGRAGPVPSGDGGQVYEEAFALVDAVLNCRSELSAAIVASFKSGLLDVPYCLHPDNAGRARGCIDADGRLAWATLGGLPLRGRAARTRSAPVGSAELMASLAYVRDRYDRHALEPEARPALAGAAPTPAAPPRQGGPS